MSWVAVDKNGSEFIFTNKPYRAHTSNGDDLGCFVDFNGREAGVVLPEGTIQRLTMKNLTYEDEPINLDEAIKEVDKLTKGIKKKIKPVSDFQMKILTSRMGTSTFDAFNNYVTGLWHSTDEEPQKDKTILYLSNLDICKVMCDENYIPNAWKVMVKAYEITKWLYVDDILPTNQVVNK